MLKNCLEVLFKRTVSKTQTCYISRYFSAVQPKSEERFLSFRTSEENPLNHTSEHTAQFYRLKDDDLKHLFSYGGLPKSFQTQTETFNETCLMVRQPSVEVINYLKVLDFSKPAVRFVLYGKKGSGKTLSLAHILHYALKDNFLIVHVPWVGNWMHRSKESSNSESREGFIDLNIDAAAWLLHFKTQNAHLLNDPIFKTSEDIIWSKRETTSKGSSFLTLIDHGVNRIKYASDTVVIICNEIKNITNTGACKTLVAIDGYNGLFYPHTKVFTEKKEVVHPHKITLTQGFLNLTKYDWKNAAILLTLDELIILEKDQISHLPRYLLGKDGFEHIDPFVPILVPQYSNKELLSCMDYYRERKWVRPFPGQDEEVAFLSASNPYKLMKICAGLM